MLVLFTWGLQSSFLSFRSKGHHFEGLSLRVTKLDLRESLGGRLGRSLGGLRR